MIRYSLKLATCVLLLIAAALPNPSTAVPLPLLYRVNAPHFPNGLVFDETAIFWFGRVTPSENYADVRVGYTNNSLWVHVNVIDQRVWYDTSPSRDTLTDWDSVTLYLDKRGTNGSALTTDSYRFDAQLNWWEPRADWQAAYRGSGGAWATTPITFETYNSWWGDAPNTTGDDHGWFIAFVIPVENLGLSGPPATGTIWGMSLALHDRDAAAGAPNPDRLWPGTLSPAQPSSWGQLHFGLPQYFPATPVQVQGSTIIRQGLNGASVQDGVVGGNTLCGGNVADYFAQWGNLNYAHDTVLNVQNVEEVSEWPCFSKVYANFPLAAVPSGKTIVSATLTLHHRGNPGPAPEPAFIQVLTVDQAWDENTLTWNNAPRARENIGGVWISSVSAAPPGLGIPYTWDVSRAVAEAYASGEPLRLALYSAAEPFHNGRYFHSSDVDDYTADARPTLTVSWGGTGASITQSVWPGHVTQGQQITYTLALIGSGRTLTLTDALPAQVSAPGFIQATGGNAAYASGSHLVTWQGAPGMSQLVTITFPVTIQVAGPAAIRNTAILTDGTIITSSSATVIANGLRVWLPLARK